MIMDYVFAPIMDEEIIEHVRELIDDHYTKFCELYLNCSIIPKQHYMLHIPDWMKK